jgi:hypothetical protein
VCDANQEASWPGSATSQLLDLASSAASPCLGVLSWDGRPSSDEDYRAVTGWYTQQLLRPRDPTRPLTLAQALSPLRLLAMVSFPLGWWCGEGVR